jgi:GxxExxY protein
MYVLTDFEEKLCSEIVDCAYRIHKALGPGLLERVYEVCFCHELAKKGIRYLRQVHLPIHYDGLDFEDALRVDVIVEDLIICELKAVEIVNPVWEAQVLSHLKLMGRNIGFLINFNVPLMKQGIRRYCIESKLNAGKA